MATPTATFEADRRSARRVAVASLVGATLEWYDFFLYGTAAALIFAKLFFPGFSPTAGTLAAFATFTVGIIARPVGGLIFGHFGDKLGRKPMLVITLALMGVSSFLIGVLPTYAAAGVAAPILLVVLRIITGLGIGGEWGSAALMMVESTPGGKRRGFYGSLPGLGAVAGFVLSTGAFAAVNLLPADQFATWGWRLPFLASILLLGVGLFIRLRIAETPTYRAAVGDRTTPARRPLRDVVRRYPRSILTIIGARMGESVAFVIFAVFVLSYAHTQLKVPSAPLLAGAVVAALVECVTMPLFGALSDRVGRRPVYLGACVFLIVYAYPFFLLIDSESMPLIWLALVLALGLGHAPLYGVQPAFFAELFDTHVRASGLGLAFGVGNVISGGIAPLVATALLAATGGRSWPIAVYLVVTAAISLVAVWFATETYRTDLTPEGQTAAASPTTSAEPPVPADVTHPARPDPFGA